MTSHESHHHHASALLKSPDGGKGARIIQIGLLCNLGLALIKLAGGWMLNSKALTADAWHSFSDLTTDILALVAVAVSSFSQSQTKISATTTARIERLLAIMAAGLLMTTAVHLGWDAVSSIRDQMMGQSALSDVKPSIQAVWPAILTVVVKESLYHASTCICAMLSVAKILTIHSHQSRKRDQITGSRIFGCAPASGLTA